MLIINREAVIALCQAGAETNLGINPLDYNSVDDEMRKLIREAVVEKNHASMDTFRMGGAQPHSIAFGFFFFLAAQQLFVD